MNVADLVIALVSLGAGAVLGVCANELAKRPKLALVGSGCVNKGVHFSYFTLRIVSQQRLVGLRLGETVLFGKSIFRGCEIGVRVPTYAADCRVVAVDSQRRSGVPLHLTKTGSSGDPLPSVNLACGESADVYVVVRGREHGEYFFFVPNSATSWEPLVPSKNQTFTGDLDFILRVHYADGRRSLEVPVSISQGIDGQLRLETSRSSISA